jgi:hypothetical protein
MHSFFRSLTLLFIAVAISSTAFGWGTTELEGGNLKFASDVDSKQVDLLKKDFQNFKSLPLNVQNSVASGVMGLPQSITVPVMLDWLFARIQYFVSESFKIDQSNIKVLRSSYSYENPGVDIVIEEGKAMPNEGDVQIGGGRTAQVAMKNIGAAIYYSGKSQSILIGTKIPGYSTVAVSSPRVGILQVGPGLFRPLLRKVDPKAPIDTMGNSISRISTLFHESRHSDGNGKSLMFAHAVCPEGHDFAGYNACDRNLNGPYAVGAHVEQILASACTTCSVAEKEALRLSALDSFSRVIKETRIPNTDSSADDVMRSTCEMLKKLYGPKSERYLNTCYKYMNSPASGARETVVPSTNWDARPEGRR